MMYSLLGLTGLVAYILTRPFDFIPSLRGLPFLYIFFALSIAGFVLDLAKGAIQWRAGPHLGWVLALLAWLVASLLLYRPAKLADEALEVLISVSIYFLLAHAITNFQSLDRIAGIVLFCALVVAIVCFHQGLQPMQCLEVPVDPRPDDVGTPIGVTCSQPHDCLEEVRDLSMSYQCEHIGIAGTTSIGGRVRYVGVLHDPNESALMISLGLPVAIARYSHRKTLMRWLTLVAMATIGGAAVVMTGSRGGQFVYAAVVGVYFVRKHGWKGVLVGALFAVPIVLLGGREGGEDSTNARLGCQYAGVQMFMSNPIFGVGHGRYIEHHSQTAHNSYVLAPAELGIVGMSLWGIVLWLTVKICRQATERGSLEGDFSEAIQTWGVALLAAFTGLTVGIAFLTFNYHFVLWTFIGLVGAFYRCWAGTHPSAVVRIGPKDFLLVVGSDLLILGFLYCYARLKHAT